MAIERFDEYLSVHIPEEYTIEPGADDNGRKMLTFHFEGDDQARYILRNAGKEADLEESKRNLNSCFHICVTAKLGEAPGPLWTIHYFLAAVLFEHHRHCYLLTCHKGISDRADLESFADKAAGFLNKVLAGITIDSDEAEADNITPQMLLQLADAAEVADEETAKAEEQRRAAEHFAQEHPDGEGVSIRAVYRDPITGKMKRDLFWERAGAESGDPEAMIKLAMAYLNGDGVEQDNEKAADYMRQAAELDEATAQYNMGIFYIQGCGVERDFSQAEHWLSLASDNGDGDADPILKSLRELPALREKAQGEDTEAKVELAKQLMAMKGDSNYSEALTYARKAADAGSLEAMWLLGLAYEHGRGVKQDYEEAFRRYKRAAEEGHAPSQSNLACLYARGDGVQKDMVKAEEWVRKAAEQGDEDGLRLLQNIDPQKAMELRQAAWEAKWRKQQEEEQKQRAAEWMKNYGQYLEKDPRIVINGSKFVFTGVMEENWPDILQKLLDRGGAERSAVSGKTDYLVVDPRGFGESKVKEALAQRVKGKPVKIVLLKDFLHALGVEKEPAAAEPSVSASQQQKEPQQEEPTGKKENTTDDKPITSMEEFRRFLQENPDAKITSVQRVSTNPITGKETRTSIYGTPPAAEGPTAEERERQEKAAREKAKKEAEEARRQEEERRKAEEARRQEEERLKREAEEKQKELDRLEAALLREENDLAGREAEIIKKEAENIKREAEIIRKETELTRKEAETAAAGRKRKSPIGKILLILLLAGLIALFAVPKYVLHEDPIAFIQRVLPAEIPGIGALSSAAAKPSAAPAPTSLPAAAATSGPAMTAKEMLQQGNRYYTGNGVPQDYTKAVEWYKKAAEAGNLTAQFNLAKCYSDGKGIERSYDKAAEWYTKAAEAGYADAQANLGLLYEKGRGVNQDNAQAVSWYTKAAEQGVKEAQYNLGVCYENGKGVSQDYKKAAEWYTKAAEQGHASAQYNLGICCFFGRGVPQDYTKAAEWFAKAAEQGYASAQYNLGVCYKNGNGVPQDYKKAAEWYTKAADQGHKRAKEALEQLKKDGKI